MSKTVKKATAVVGCAMLASSAIVAPAMAIESNGTCDAVAIQDVSQEAVATESHDAVSKVVGTFVYTQDSLSSNAYISGIFSKAAATLCASLPDYAVRSVASDLRVSGIDGLSWTVPEQMLEEGDSAKIIGCSCASNAPGGGAVAQAEVSGVSLEALVALAQSR